MYNRYMPPDTVFHPVPSQEGEEFEHEPPHANHHQEESAHSPKKAPASDLLDDLTGGIGSFLSGIFQNFSLENLDSGDILLLLIILFLFLEGDNLDLVIALGLMLLLGLGEDPKPST